MRLQLIGTLEYGLTKGLQQFNFMDYEIILGEITPGGAALTLCGCLEIERKSPYIEVTTKLTTQKFKMDCVLFGFHINTLHEFVFKHFEFSTTYLMDWRCAQQFDTEYDDDNTVITQRDIQEIKMHDGQTLITLSSWGKVSLSKIPSPIQQASLQIDLELPMSVEDFKIRYLVPLVDLIQFGSSHLNSVIFINAIPKNQTREGKLYITNDFSRINYSIDSFRENALFHLSELEGKEEELILNWLRLHESIPHVFKLYFDSINIGFQFQVSRFLNVIQALESYHAVRENNDGKAILRDRLKNLLTEAADLLLNLIKNQAQFSDDLVGTRNYYTHYGLAKKHKAATDLHLDALIHVGRILLNYNFLLRCGIPGDQARDIIQRGAYWSSLTQIVRENNLWQN
jgi:hypothetical protein